MSNTPLEQNGIDLDSVLAKVNALPQAGIAPSGSITLTEEKSYNVTEKATAVVDFSSTRANLAEAITAKGVDTLPASSFDTIATNIGLISGGNLPSVISKIDSGSFTLAVDTSGSSYPISHNLGVIPKCYAIWTDDNDAFEASANNTLIHAFGYIGDANNSATLKDGGYRAHYTRQANGSTTTFSSTFQSTEKGQYATATTIYWGSTNKYKAGCTYKWLAWA